MSPSRNRSLNESKIHPAIKRTERRRSGIWILDPPCRRRDIPSTISAPGPGHAAPAHSARSPRRNPPMFRAAEARRQAFSSRLPRIGCGSGDGGGDRHAGTFERSAAKNGSRSRGASRPSDSLLSLVLRYQRDNVTALLASESCKFRMRTKPRLPAMQLHASAARIATRRHQLGVRKKLHFVAFESLRPFPVQCRFTPAAASMASMCLRA